METTTTISKNVMRRVRIIHATRPFLSMTSLAAFVFLVAVWGIGREVWVAHIVQNLTASSQSGHLASYLVAAFVNTRFVVQALVLTSLVTFVYALAPLARSLAPTQRYA